MPKYASRNRSAPYATVDRDVVLDLRLSATARLLYVVLQARPDGELSAEETAELVGLAGADDMQPAVDELVGAGLVMTGPHLGQPPSITVYCVPLPPQRRGQGCVPCERCGQCSCEHTPGLCRMCDRIRRVEQATRQDVERWQRRLEEGATYAIGRTGSRLHRWDCPSLTSPERSAEAMETSRLLTEGRGLHWPQLPDLYTAQELRLKRCRKRRCAMCGPEPL